MSKRNHKPRPTPPIPDEPAIDLGPCCTCGGRVDVVNVLMLSHAAPTPGTGWGCVVCGLPANGALAVLCDGCLGTQRKPREICVGYPSAGERMPIEEAKQAPRFEHDLTKHVAYERLTSATGVEPLMIERQLVLDRRS